MNTGDPIKVPFHIHICFYHLFGCKGTIFRRKPNEQKQNETVAFYKEKLIKPYKDSTGYLVVSLRDNKGNTYRKKIHRLVAQAFLPNPDNLNVVNHKDENKLNNVVENLEWCTTSYNANYGTRNVRIQTALSNKVA